MNAKQENKYTMYLAVKAACDKDQAAWKDLAAFANSCAKFNTCVTNIKSLAEAQERQSGAAEEKQILRQEMCMDAAVVAGAVGAWAADNKKNDIAQQVNYSEYDLMGGRDTASASKCQIILDAARDNAASLVGYLKDVTDALDTLENKIKAYGKSIIKPTEARKTAKGATEKLKKEFETADGLLEERLDKLVVQFKSSAPVFLTAYQSARETTANAATREAKTEPDNPPQSPKP
ncbi:MAG: hypothetical protein AAB676_18020 [Verrucomicrobiota bacterium]